MLFHGWHHVIFVKKKALDFARPINADLFFVETAALVHDLNYIVKVDSEPEEAKNFRVKILAEGGFDNSEINRIENIISESHIAARDEKISDEGKALSDADTLFKSLPITPILFAGNYLKENKVDIFALANKITSEQNQLMKKGIYFYTDLAKDKYLEWAKTNIALWNNVKESLGDEDVSEMLKNARSLNVI